ncbi:pyridoxamine 5'-phosphate oxidase [Sunxiuqinia dokdonensis]|uniref:Pyridoxine/pyridoxamine 5'-phosphate oxidase n=1 Tax=Sunxiuqinia dokdonensis TaxID=1409788 RepID=A0A0L8V7N0_9BACT|nr:pyridoxamine 5'-phosphate oxidase [Sunxiuqinia dokdonensis]KOH44192.1 pyridoxamine 5'-phosphate oxidase [Sunxiuqinia dokdonensis]
MLREIRNNYQKHKLEEAKLPEDPIALFDYWLKEAIKEKVQEPTAMVVATAADGIPDARIVLLKEISDGNFHFYTNYHSTKGRQLATNPHVALNFFWPELERQVRVKGTTSKVNDALSEEYFNTRPRESQLGAWASAQSETLTNRQQLEQKYEELEKHYEGEVIPKPAHWGGYQVEPFEIEFWQGRPGRLHDRIQYQKNAQGQWTFRRLSP